MRRFLLVLAVLFALAFTNLAVDAKAEQGSWQPRLSLYSGEFYSIAFASETTVWAAGSGGVLLSEDGGQSWRWTLNTLIYAVDAAGDGIHGWAVGPSGAIFATSDGGKTWNRQVSGTDLSLSSVAAFDSQRALAMGAEPQGDLPQSFPKNIVLRTEDGGTTWLPVQLPTKVELHSLEALKGGTRAWLSATKCNPDPAVPNGCAFGGSSVLFLSDDSGRSWQEISTQTVWGMKFTSAKTSWALDNKALVYTDDGGKSWRVVRQWPENKYPRNLSVLGNGAIVLVETEVGTSAQQVIKSTDAGATWSNVGQPTSAISGLAYSDEQHAIRSNWDQTVQWSGDGGATWKPAATPAFASRVISVNSHPQFDFIDSRNGWIAGSKLLRTSDAGLSWDTVSDLQFNSVDFVSPTEGWATQTILTTGYRSATAVLHTVDGGAIWQEQVRREGEGNITFVDRLNGWMTLGSDKPVLHTCDGGLTWSEQEPPSRQLTFVDDTIVWAVEGASLWVSVNGGDTWALTISRTGEDGCSVENLAATDDRHVWITAYTCSDERPQLLLERSVDAGAHWEHLLTPATGQFDLLDFFNSSDGVAVRAVCSETEVNKPCNQVMMMTRDGGSTWANDSTPFYGMYFEEFQFTDLWHGWMSETIGGGMMDIQEQNFFAYSGAPPVVMPDTGGGQRQDVPVGSFAALGALGVLLAGAAAFARLSSRREVSAGG